MGQKISFYSFKGGTGRSTGLCNVAYTLAEQGRRVGCIDFDVEAAGLNFIYDIPAGRLDDCGKVQEFVIPDRRHTVDSVHDFVLDVGEIKNYQLDGELFMVPAGADPALTKDLPQERDLMAPIEELYQRFEAEYDLDYLFIDTRSGISNMAVPSILNAEEVVVFFRWSRQHRRGTATLVQWLRSKILGFGDTTLFAVASNIPDSVTTEDIDEFVATRLEGVRGHTIVNESERLKRREQILTHTAPETETAQQFQRLAEAIR